MGKLTSMQSHKQENEFSSLELSVKQTQTPTLHAYSFSQMKQRARGTANFSFSPSRLSSRPRQFQSPDRRVVTRARYKRLESYEKLLDAHYFRDVPPCILSSFFCIFYFFFPFAKRLQCKNLRATRTKSFSVKKLIMFLIMFPRVFHSLGYIPQLRLQVYATRSGMLPAHPLRRRYTTATRDADSRREAPFAYQHLCATRYCL